MRLVPHDQDMGGFFATLLRKVGPIPGPPPRRGSAEAVSKKNAETPGSPLPPMTTPTPKTHAYVPARTDVLRALNEAWGTDMTATCLFARDASATPASLTYFAPGARAQCTEAAGASRVKCVWGGARVFERRGAGVGEWKPRKPVKRVGAGSSSSDLGKNVTEENVPEEERVTAASFVSRYRLTQDGASALGARARRVLRAGRPLRGDAEPRRREAAFEFRARRAFQAPDPGVEARVRGALARVDRGRAERGARTTARAPSGGGARRRRRAPAGLAIPSRLGGRAASSRRRNRAPAAGKQRGERVMSLSDERMAMRCTRYQLRYVTRLV